MTTDPPQTSEMETPCEYDGCPYPTNLRYNHDHPPDVPQTADMRTVIEDEFKAWHVMPDSVWTAKTINEYLHDLRDSLIESLSQIDGMGALDG